MMLDKEPVGAPGILQLISTLSAQGASGRLDLLAGATEGALLFKNGKLVDARMGHLTGFQAMNAVASLRDARFQFDPTAAIPSSSSITTSERLVLRQFFGIETVGPNDYSAPTPAPADELEEATVIGSHVASAPTETSPAETVASYQVRSTAPYLIAFAVTVLVVALVAAAVALRSRYRERTMTASVATSSEPDSPALAAEPTRSLPAEPTENEQPGTTASKQPASKQPATTAPEQPATTAPEQPVTTAPDLTGKWNVVNTVQTTGRGAFQNLQIGFALSINQTGSTFTAKGQKVSENGRSLPASSRTPIQLKGFINGDRVEATFSEQGALRKTNGRFVWKIDRAGGLMGTFASTAAQSSGKSTAKREL